MASRKDAGVGRPAGVEMEGGCAEVLGWRRRPTALVLRIDLCTSWTGGDPAGRLVLVQLDLSKGLDHPRSQPPNPAQKLRALNPQTLLFCWLVSTDAEKTEMVCY